jgi:hypothetical protein
MFSVPNCARGLKLGVIKAFRCRVYSEHAAKRKQFQDC